MKEEDAKIYARNQRRHDEWVRQPILRFLRLLRGLPAPKVTVDQAIEITRDYLVNVKGYPENLREAPLLVTSELQHYEIRPLMRWDSYDKLKVDMADGRIDYVEARYIIM